jgi:hypothetical protein
LQTAIRCAFDRDTTTEFGVHVATFLHIALAFARASRGAFHNGVDERAADGFVRHGIHREDQAGASSSSI